MPMRQAGRVGASRRYSSTVLPLLAALLAVPVVQPAAAQASSSSRLADAGLRAEIAKRAKGDVRQFYAARGNAPIWLDQFNRPGGSASLLLAQLRGAQFDGLQPRKLKADRLADLVDKARRGDVDDIAKAEIALSETFAAYVAGMRGATDRAAMLYESDALAPVVPSARAALDAASASPSLEQYLDAMGWMHPLYAPLRKAMEDPRMSEPQRRQVWTNLARVRAIPVNNGRHILVDAAGARLWMYDGGKPVDSMRVVVGKPEQQTPMMAGFIRYAVVNPYWNIPDDLVQHTIAANVLDRGLGYLKSGGYQVLADWRDDAPVISPATVNWRDVFEGRQKVHVRQLPGGDNFMGKVKFMFPNAQGIYLHDTPARNLMRLDARQLSSGCVRLEDADRLGRWLMGAPIKAKGKAAEQVVALPEVVPVYITYLTATPQGSGIAFRNDPYGRDGAAQLAALER